MKRNTVLILYLILSGFVIGQDKQGTFKDTEDGAIDMSNWLAKKIGFLAVPILITEPAIGYGGGLNIMFFHSSLEEKQAPPSVSGILGGYTQSDSWFAGGYHRGFWKEDNMRYVGALVKTDLNVEYYGTRVQLKTPIILNLNTWIIFQKLTYRLKESNFFLGGQYLFVSAENTFEFPVNLPEYIGTGFSSQLSEIGLVTTIDTRNNVFSPDNGWYFDGTYSYSDKWIGGDTQYGRFSLDLRFHHKFSEKWMGSVRLFSNHSTNNTPFWATPFVNLRGVPALKFQNNQATSIEGEFDFNVSKRWSLDAFLGYGMAYQNFNSFDNSITVGNYGGGFRYLLARKFGIKGGMDFGFSNDNDFAFYFIIGHAWN